MNVTIFSKQHKTQLCKTVWNKQSNLAKRADLIASKVNVAWNANLDYITAAKCVLCFQRVHIFIIVFMLVFYMCLGCSADSHKGRLLMPKFSYFPKNVIFTVVEAFFSKVFERHVIIIILGKNFYELLCSFIKNLSMKHIILTFVYINRCQ